MRLVFLPSPLTQLNVSPYSFKSSQNGSRRICSPISGLIVCYYLLVSPFLYTLIPLEFNLIYFSDCIDFSRDLTVPGLSSEGLLLKYTRKTQPNSDAEPVFSAR